VPASKNPDIQLIINNSNADGVASNVSVTRYRLHGVVSQISEHAESDPKNIIKHHVLHLRQSHQSNPSLQEAAVVAADGSEQQDSRKEWFLLNDFVVCKTAVSEVLHFPNYRHPELLYYERVVTPGSSLTSPSGSTKSSPTTNTPANTPASNQPSSVQATQLRHLSPTALLSASLGLPLSPVRALDQLIQLPESVLSSPSLSATPGITISPLTQTGDLIAIDGEVNQITTAFLCCL
jgi:hypothetical protein